MDDEYVEAPPFFFGIGWIAALDAEPPDEESPPRPFPIGFARPTPDPEDR